jgi:preflagellin peptidase FlaK
MDATLPDLLRLAALPVFAVAAVHDYRDRRVPNRLWLPVLAVALLALLGDVAGPLVTGDPLPAGYLTSLGLSLAVVPLAFGVWFVGLAGGADAKAVMAVALLFPTTPTYGVAGVDLPLAAPGGVPFVAVVVVNALVVGMVYLLHLAVRNALAGRIAAQAIYALPVPSTGVTDRYGIVLSPSGGGSALAYVGAGGIDAEVLRQYRDWRGLDPDQSWTAAKRRRESGGDPWGTQRFIASAGMVYGATPKALRETLEYLDQQERVWFSPAVPYVVPLVVGLVLALTVGFLPTLAV